jgi:hypothetical protein
VTRGKTAMLGEMRESDAKKQKAKGGSKADASRKLHGLVQQRMERTFGAITPSNKATPSPRLSPSHPLVVEPSRFAAGLAEVQEASRVHRFRRSKVFGFGGERVSASTGTLAAYD